MIHHIVNVRISGPLCGCNFFSPLDEMDARDQYVVIICMEMVCHMDLRVPPMRAYASVGKIFNIYGSFIWFDSNIFVRFIFGWSKMIKRGEVFLPAPT